MGLITGFLIAQGIANSSPEDLSEAFITFAIVVFLFLTIGFLTSQKFLNFIKELFLETVFASTFHTVAVALIGLIIFYFLYVNFVRR